MIQCQCVSGSNNSPNSKNSVDNSASIFLLPSWSLIVATTLSFTSQFLWSQTTEYILQYQSWVFKERECSSREFSFNMELLPSFIHIQFTSYNLHIFQFWRNDKTLFNSPSSSLNSPEQISKPSFIVFKIEMECEKPYTL